jgi:hypothetical protein
MKAFLNGLKKLAEPPFYHYGLNEPSFAAQSNGQSKPLMLYIVANDSGYNLTFRDQNVAKDSHSTLETKTCPNNTNMNLSFCFTLR